MLSIIVAVDENFLIGNGNDLPWNEPEDLKYFKKVTLGHSLIMGYNTYLSIVNRIGKTLPGRTSYVLTYEKELKHDAIIVNNIDELINKFKDEELFVIGGKMVYEMLLPKADKLYLTRIEGAHEGNVYFPTINFSEFKLISSKKENNLTFEVYERISNF